jgi:hypothetical protein
MKTIGAALLSSLFTALLFLFVLRDRLFVPPPTFTNVLSVRELHVVDETGSVRMTLGTHGRWSEDGNPQLELIPRGLKRAGAGLYLDASGNGTLWFSTEQRDGKVRVGHFITGDVIPPSLSDHSWGISVSNPRPVKGAPSSLYFAASDGGNVGITGVTMKQGLPPDVQPVTVRRR